MKEFFREYFCFSRGERNGTIVLSAIMLLVFAFPHIHELLVTPSPYLPDPVFMEQARAYYGLDSSAPGPAKGGPDQSKPNERGYHTGGWLDPLSDTNDRLPATKVENNQINASSSGDDRVKGQLSPGISKIELNSADTADLMGVRGLGPVLAGRIIRYRDILGGYIDVSQLNEVYGIDSTRFNQIEPFIYADSRLVHRLRPGHDEFGTLLRHPYLNYEQVSYIFRLRREGINSIDDLAGSSAFSPKETARLLPYLLFE